MTTITTHPAGDAPRPMDVNKYSHVTHAIAGVPLKTKFGRGWYFGVTCGLLLLMVFVWAVTVLLALGIGVWGLNQPVGWAFDIINFVWWIGIGHAGTLISAILLLFRQEWRTSINRFAEAMTIFAVMCAGMFPLLHLGRIWKFYYLMPYPNTMALWPQWRSPLVWDVFAVSTYATVSFLFWYIGLIPDLATLRDEARRFLPKLGYGILAMGWRGSARHWHRHSTAYLLLAGLSTPLVLSVHSVVSFDFAVGIVPGWHATIFPPYFVAGAIYAGFAMVIILCVPLRAIYRARGFATFISDDHINKMAKVMLCTGLIVGYGYAMEVFFGWYSGSIYENGLLRNRFYGPYAWSYWSLIVTNILIPQLLWIPKVRVNMKAVWAIAMVISVGMWLERFVIIVVSLNRDFMPSAWHMYYPTKYEIGLYAGTIGLFITAIFLFVRLMPAISIYEMRELSWHHKHESGGHADPHATHGPTHSGVLDSHPPRGATGAFTKGGKL